MTSPHPIASTMPLRSLRGRALDEAVALLRIGAPLMVAQIAYVSMGFFDTLMMGHVGPTELAAVAIGASLWHPLYLSILGILMALSPSVAHLFGAGDAKGIGRLTRQTLWLSLFLSLPTIALLRHAEWILVWLRVDPPIIPLAQDYLTAMSWGVVAILAFTVLRFLSEGIAFTRPIMRIGFIGAIVNIIGNYVLIYGHLGFPALGVVGCGLATAIGMWSMLGCMLALVLRHPRYQSVALAGGFEWPNWLDLRPLLRLGLPIGLSLFAESSLFAAIALVLGFLGATVVAGHQIALNVASLTFMVPLSLTMAITVRVGHAMGRQAPSEARFIGLTGISMAGLVMTVMAMLIFLLAKPIAGIYTHDLEVIDIAAGLLGFAAIFQVSDGLQVSAGGALRGIKDTAVPMLMTILAYWVIGFPTGYWLAIHWNQGASGMWIGLIAGLSVAAILLNTRFFYVVNRHISRRR